MSDKDVYVVAFDPDTQTWMCSCGASAPARDGKRFQKRHPRLCSERYAYNHQLSKGVRSVEDAERREWRESGKGGRGFLLGDDE